LVRQLLGEGLLLGLLAGALALPLSRVALRLLLTAGPATLPDAAELPLDPRVFFFALLAALLAGAAATIGPAIRTATVDPAETLRAAAHRTPHRGGRAVLLAGQVALALVLLVAAGLLGRSQRALDSVPAGCDPRGVLTASVSLPAARYPDSAA